MEKWNIPGGALEVIQEGEVALARGYGFADIENNKLVQPDSFFRIASISKPITAVAVIKLVEDSNLSLEDSAFIILEDLFPSPGRFGDPRLETVTVRN